MAIVADIPHSEPSPLSEKATKDLLPGTTIPDRLPASTADSLSTANGSPTGHNDQPASVPGPLVNNRPTTLRLYSPPSQMQNATCISSLVNMLNASFSAAHEISNTFAPELNRLSSAEQYLIELGNDPATFSYVLTYQDNFGKDGEVVLATCAGMRFYGNATAMIKQPDGSEKKSSFKRVGFPDPATEVWEVRHLGVDVGAQKQGLAGWLIVLVEEEVRRRFWAARKAEEKAGHDGEEKGKVERLSMFLTTMKETNGRFYEKRGYHTDEDVRYEIGHMGTRSPFSVIHMSKTLE